MHLFMWREVLKQLLRFDLKTVFLSERVCGDGLAWLLYNQVSAYSGASCSRTTGPELEPAKASKVESLKVFFTSLFCSSVVLADFIRNMVVDQLWFSRNLNDSAQLRFLRLIPLSTTTRRETTGCLVSVWYEASAGLYLCHGIVTSSYTNKPFFLDLVSVLMAQKSSVCLRFYT